MAEGFINFTEGSGKKLRTWNRTIGANSTEEQFVIPGEYPTPSYMVYATAVSGATAASHTIQLMAGASLNVRVRRIFLHAIAATVGTVRFEVVRLTTAGTGGTALTVGKMDNGDAAVGATAMTLPTVKGTEGAFLWPITVGSAAAAPQSAVNESGWVQHPNSKAIIIPAGTANGIALKCSGLAATTFDVAMEFTETSFV